MSETFTHFFNRTVAKVKVVEKSSSWLMKVIAWFLALLTKMKIIDFPVKKFMEEYTTTILSTIYSGHMTEDSEPNSLVVHEFTHVMQWHDGKIGFVLSYLFSPMKRAFYESEAHQAAMLLSKNRWSDEHLENTAKKLTGYGCDYKISLDLLQVRREEVEKGEPRPLPLQVVLAVEHWRADVAA